MKIVLRRCVLFSLAFMTLLSGCAKKSISQDSFITLISGKVTLQRIDKTLVDAAVKTQMQSGDVIRTDKRSFVIIQSGENAVIRIEENSRVIFADIKDISVRTIQISQGTLLTKIKKLSKNETYQTRTETIIASVRGTGYMIRSSGKESVVAVAEGAVAVMALTSKREKDLASGNSIGITVTDTITEKVRSINSEERFELSKLDNLLYVNDIQKISAEEIREKYKDIVTGQYGETPAEPPAVITLYTGQVIRGSIISRGSVWKVKTENGVIEIDEKKIQRTSLK